MILNKKTIGAFIFSALTAITSTEAMMSGFGGEKGEEKEAHTSASRQTVLLTSEYDPLHVPAEIQKVPGRPFYEPYFTPHLRKYKFLPWEEQRVEGRQSSDYALYLDACIVVSADNSSPVVRYIIRKGFEILELMKRDPAFQMERMVIPTQADLNARDLKDYDVFSKTLRELRRLVGIDLSDDKLSYTNKGPDLLRARAFRFAEAFQKAWNKKLDAEEAKAAEVEKARAAERVARDAAYAARSTRSPHPVDFSTLRLFSPSSATTTMPAAPAPTTTFQDAPTRAIETPIEGTPLDFYGDKAAREFYEETKDLYYTSAIRACREFNLQPGGNEARRQAIVHILQGVLDKESDRTDPFKTIRGEIEAELRIFKGA